MCVGWCSNVLLRVRNLLKLVEYLYFCLGVVIHNEFAKQM